MERFFSLFKLKLKSNLLQILHISTGEKISSLCIFSLFAFFTFLSRDFFLEIKPFINKFENISTIFTTITTLTAIIIIGKITRLEISKQESYYNFSKFINDSPRTRYLYLLINRTILTLLSTFVILNINKKTNSHDIYNILYMFITIYVFVILYEITPFPKRDHINQHITTKFKIKDPSHSLASWQQLILLRDLKSRIYLSLSLILMISSCLLIFYIASPIIISINCWLSGLMFSFALLSSIARRNQYIWIEKNSGVSHNEIVHSINIINTKSALIPSIIILIISLLQNYLFLDKSLAVVNILTSCKYCFIYLFSSWIIQHLIFQIDINKHTAHLILVTFISMIFCSFIYLSLNFLIALPLIHLYGKSSQSGRFYYQ
jgi:hypothetical protein